MFNAKRLSTNSQHKKQGNSFHNLIFGSKHDTEHYDETTVVTTTTTTTVTTVTTTIATNPRKQLSLNDVEIPHIDLFEGMAIDRINEMDNVNNKLQFIQNKFIESSEKNGGNEIVSNPVPEKRDSETAELNAEITNNQTLPIINYDLLQNEITTSELAPSTSPTDSSSSTTSSVFNIPSKRHYKRTGSMPNMTAPDLNSIIPDMPVPNRPERRHTIGNQAETPQQYLERMQDTLSKSELATLLAKNKDVFHETVLLTYMESFDFTEDPIDIALRKFLMDCYLPKETQQIDRIMEAFARRYHECNPDLFPSQDTSYILAFSLLMLHTDAFNKSVKKKMTKEEFVRNARIDGVPSEILEVLYDNITFTQFIYAEDDTDVNGMTLMPSPQHSKFFGGIGDGHRKIINRPRNDPYFVIQHKIPTDFTPNLRSIVPTENPFSYKGTLPVFDTASVHRAFTTASTVRVTGIRSRRQYGDTSNSVSAIHPVSNQPGAFQLKITKAGKLGRKIDLLEGGKKATGFGRTWKQFGVVLSGSQLMFFKDLSWFEEQSNAVRDVNHNKKNTTLRPDIILMTADSIAVYETAYTKHPHVFRLACVKGYQYLFQAESESEMNDWITKINYAAAFKTNGIKMRGVRHTSSSKRSEKVFRNEGYADGAVARVEVLKSKIASLQAKITTHTSQLTRDVRLVKNLTIMVPYKGSTRDRILSIANVISKRLISTFLELSKLLCYHEVLEKDLCATVMEDNEYWMRRSSVRKMDGILSEKQDSKRGLSEEARNHCVRIKTNKEGRHGTQSLYVRRKEANEPEVSINIVNVDSGTEYADNSVQTPQTLSRDPSPNSSPHFHPNQFLSPNLYLTLSTPSDSDLSNFSDVFIEENIGYEKNGLGLVGSENDDGSLDEFVDAEEGTFSE